jgi:superfamily II DNA/RNA helicase/HKD family nuclease
MSTKFFTNTHDRTLFDKFKGIVEGMPNLHAFYAVVGYFRSSGYFALQPYLSKLKEIKILVGINVDHMFAEAQRKGLLYFGDPEKTKEEFLSWFIQDVKEAKYDQQVEEGILAFVNDLIAGRIEVRAHNSAKLHAKFYLFLPEAHTEHSDGWVIMGSSNLTDAGLGIQQSPNYELNIAIKDFDDVDFTRREFERLWKESTAILPADMQRFKGKTHLGQVFTPYELYMKLLMEYFGKNIDYDPDSVGDLPKEFKKLSYQVEAVNQGFQMLLDHNGFFLADVVGLGKTVVAALIAKRFLITNGSLNTKILVVYPPALEKNWKSTFKRFGIDRHAKFITNGSLDKVLGESLDYWPKEDYDLILVDEAHRFRNHRSTAFNNLQRICKSPRSGEGKIPGRRKKVMLITATPLNNRPQDLYYQMLLFQDSRKSTIPGIANLQNFFGPITREYKLIMQAEQPDLASIRALYTRIRERVIEQVTVRRTRRDLKNYPKYLKDLEEQGIKFPEATAPRAKYYELTGPTQRLFYKTIFFLTDKDKVRYYRYQAIRYLKPELQDLYYEQAVLVSNSLAGIMKTLMVKRLESSFHAFRISLGNLRTATERMIAMFDQGKVLIAPDLRVNDLQDKGLSIENIESLILEAQIDNPRNNVFTADDFDEELIKGLKKDHELLTELVKAWAKITDDPKWNAFEAAMAEELFHPDLNPPGKLVLFTESADTASYLTQLVEKSGRKTLSISAKNRAKEFEKILANFDANYSGKRSDEYPVIITTDVLAEGINLHRANVIVNYDTPWNATRLMQRIGRVNRIGSQHTVYNYNFYPSQEGDEEIKLYKNALLKLQGFHSAFGEDTQIFSHEELVEQFELFKDGLPDEEDKRIHFLREIRQFKDENPTEYKRIKALPIKARTGRKAPGSPHPGLPDSTVTFLKSAYKLEFYRIAGGQVQAIGFVEAAEHFQAAAMERPHPLPDHHHPQVNLALRAFEKDYLATEASTAAPLDQGDAQSLRARKYLRDCKRSSQQAAAQAAFEKLIALIELGSYTAIAGDVNRIRQRREKNLLTHAQADNLLLDMARKYDLPGIEADPDGLPEPTIELNLSPDVVLSITFLAP